MLIKVAAIVLAVLLWIPDVSDGASAADPPRVRLRATAQLTATGVAANLDATRWQEGWLVVSDADSITLGMGAAGDPAGIRVPRWAITAFEVYGGKSRGMSTLIGVGVGIGVGGIWAATAHGQCDGQMLCDAGLVILPMITVTAGAVTGLLVGSARWVPATVESVAPVVNVGPLP